MSRIDNRTFNHRMNRPGVSTRALEREATVLVVEDEPQWLPAIEELCAFLEIRLTLVSGSDDLARTLRDRRPMAVLASMDGGGQDGCHVMKLVAAHDPNLPMMVLTGGDAALAGAADAVEEIWRLTSVVKHSSLPTPGEMVDFLARAGQRGRCLGLMSL